MLKIFRNKTNTTIYTTGKLEKWINLYIENPLATWYRVKKYFKRPKISFSCGRITKISGYPYITYKHIGKIIDVYIHDVQWKDKWDSPRHESNPLIWICLFRYIYFAVYFNIYYKDEFGIKKLGDSYYWEYLLNYLFYKYKKTLKCYSNWIYESSLYNDIKYGDAEDGSEDTSIPHQMVIPTVVMSLNKKGINKLKQEIYDKDRNT